MNRKLSLWALAFSLLAMSSLAAAADGYAINWYKIAGGGGTSTGGTFSVTGTIGQPEASGVMKGGNYAVTGGFWSLIQVMQTPDAPALFLSHSGNVVTIYWQSVTGWNLHQSGNLATPLANWTPSPQPTLLNGTNYVSFTNPTGNLFFRLNNP